MFRLLYLLKSIEIGVHSFRPRFRCGQRDNESVLCGKNSNRTNNTIPVRELTEDQLEILMLRTGITSELDDICRHHLYFYIESDKYFAGRAAKIYCNPFSTHSTNVKGIYSFFYRLVENLRSNIHMGRQKNN